MVDMKSMANVDGNITLLHEGKIPIMDRGFLYGDSVYEVFCTKDGVPLFLEDHFNRLENSARLIQMHFSQTREDLLRETRLTVKATGATESEPLYVRWQITRGEGMLDLYPDPQLKTRYVILAKALPVWQETHYSRGVHLAITRIRRNLVNALDPNIKGGNYLNNILALSEAKSMGSDDSIMLTHEGFVTEASNSNVWFVIDGSLLTPGRGNLAGLTKLHLHKALKAQGIESEETDIHVDQLVNASECFVTSATRNIMPCAALMLEDGATIEFPLGGGELTRKIQRVFSTYVCEYVETHRSDSLL